MNRPPPFISHTFRPQKNNDPSTGDSHDRNKYKCNSKTQHRPLDRGHFHESPVPSYFHKNRQNSNNHYNTHAKNVFNESNESFQGSINDLGDVDHRHPPNTKGNRDNYGNRHTTWINPAFETKKHFYNRSPQKYFQNHERNETQRLSSDDYTGHRPPSSDHYRDIFKTTTNNTAFSKSVDDTVDIIRKRLRDRSDGHLLASQEPTIENKNDAKSLEPVKTDTDNQQDQPSKRRIQRPIQVVSNCDKIKSNIVHQLFKMDKNKIHKLMDNPSSSTKFEYAISSLITESQNSLNRQIRSVAEKSLNNPSSNCINDDNNTIYEDTFMKEMQCLLDPQDTVFLEDIKPIVMAELNKVLQLDEYGQECDIYIENQTSYQSNEPPDYTYSGEHTNYEDQPYNYENKLYEQELASELYLKKSDDAEVNDDLYVTNPDNNKESEQLYVRRSTMIPNYTEKTDVDRRYSTENHRQSRKSVETANEDGISKQSSMPLFVTNTEQFSEEEDPFAELDQQYHVAVDHNFINNDDLDSPVQSVASSHNKSPNTKKEINTISTSHLNTSEVRQDIDSQLQKIAKSPLKCWRDCETDDITKVQFLGTPKENVSSTLHSDVATFQEYNTVQSNNITTTKSNELNNTEKSEHCGNIVKVSTPPNSRKRSIDQMPSHRKEKRKKSESSPSDADHQNSNKIHLPKSQNAAKASSNMGFPKENNDNPSDKTTTEKYVKRKTESKKSKDTTNKKNNSSLTSHSILSQRDSCSSSFNNEVQNKSDTKTKLKTIDMFMNQPKKSTSIHQAHRNTATAVSVTKTVEENKTKPSILKATSKVNHVSTQVMRKVLTKEVQTSISRCSKSRFCQTERKKLTTRGVQTDHILFAKTTSKATDCLERMKEIDLEIQVLLQEKFKLYNSIESKDSCQSTMQSLGMTVLSVTPLDEDKVEEEDLENTLSEDAIVDSFTSIPVEELEQIALESVQNENADLLDGNKPIRIKKQSSRDLERNSASPTVTKSGRKVKPPNISLLEQIITSDKPLEDIIVLDELESSPVKPIKKKSQKRPALKKKSVRKLKNTKLLKDYSAYKIKECTVLLERQDISQYLIQLSDLDIQQHTPLAVSLDSMPETDQETMPQPDSRPQVSDKFLPLGIKHDDIPVNDIQLDMLDVSEDIIIGDVCEVKYDDMNNQLNQEFVVNEEIILDNSQSSCEEITSDTSQGNIVCKTFDYSTDENLLKDSITVTGNADSILAIEVCQVFNNK